MKLNRNEIEQWLLGMGVSCQWGQSFSSAGWKISGDLLHNNANILNITKVYV